MATGEGRVRLEDLPHHAWISAAVLLFAVVYTTVEVAFVRPAMSPAHPAAFVPGVLLTRPPVLSNDPTAAAITLDRWRSDYWTSGSDLDFGARGQISILKGSHPANLENRDLTPGPGHARTCRES